MNEPEASYAYLLEKDKKRTCQKDLAYCTWDEKGNPIPFCFEYPNDKKCQHNTHPPNILFMGCYDDPTCDGKPVGAPIIRRSTPPYAYTIDGKCRPSSEMCYWLTDEIAVPTCAKDVSVAKCRDIADNYLLGCYTDETCGGLKQPQPLQQQPQQIKKEYVDNTRVDQRSTDETPKEHEYIVDIADAGNGSVSKKKKPETNIALIVALVVIVILLLVILFLYSYYQRKHKKHKKYSIQSPQRKPTSVMKNRTV